MKTICTLVTFSAFYWRRRLVKCLFTIRWGYNSVLNACGVVIIPFSPESDGHLNALFQNNGGYRKWILNTLWMKKQQQLFFFRCRRCLRSTSSTLTPRTCRVADHTAFVSDRSEEIFHKAAPSVEGRRRRERAYSAPYNIDRDTISGTRTSINVHIRTLYDALHCWWRLEWIRRYKAKGWLTLC